MIRPAFRPARLALAALALLTGAGAARAERLTFDHRLYPPLKATLDSGDTAMVAYDGSNPRHVVDVIAVHGRSAADWDEALEIIARTPARNMTTAREWLAESQAAAARRCPGARVETLAEDADSVTFAEQLADCPRPGGETRLGRIVAGRRSLFAITFILKGQVDAKTRAGWLALLNSAHIE